MSTELSVARRVCSFPDDNLYKRMSVLGNLQFYCHLYRLPKTRPMEVLEQVGLADQAHTSAESSPLVCPGGLRWDAHSLPTQRSCCW